MRTALKFIHILGAIGFLGAIAALLVLQASLPAPAELGQYAALRMAMGSVARWLLLPSMGVVLVGGLLALALTPAYHSRAWAWLKLVLGVLIFEATLVYIQGPMERAARQADAALAGELPAAELAATPGGPGALWVVGAVALANVVLGVWRPRLIRSGSASEERGVD